MLNPICPDQENSDYPTREVGKFGYKKGFKLIETAHLPPESSSRIFLQSSNFKLPQLRTHCKRDKKTNYANLKHQYESSRI
jgi:hypothetical protein